MKSKTKYLTLKDYEERASDILPSAVLSYIRNGANNEVTLKNNYLSWKRYRLRPRMLRGVADRNLKTSLLGQTVSMPIGIAPTALHRLASEEGEIGTSRAAGEQGCVFVMSTIANETPERVAENFPTEGVLWFQLYIFKDRERSMQLVHRVERSGFQALVVTVDVPVIGQRKDNAKYQLQVSPSFCLPFLTNNEELSTIGGDTKKLIDGIGQLYDDNITWEDIRWLAGQTKLPLIVKGIMSGQDAILAFKAGCKAVWVSNHGARQLDNEPSTADVLKEVVDSLSGCSCEIYVDGGVRNGTDVLTALALGAQAVFIGRPALYGLACDGQQGVENVLRLLRSELDTAMALCGVRTVEECRDQSLVVHEKQLPARL